MSRKPASDLAALVALFDRPAVIVGADGLRHGNAAFDALPPKTRIAAIKVDAGWTAVDLPSGAKLIATRIGDRLMAQERFLATLSHEIRTPLNGVLGMAGLLERTRLDGHQKDYLRALRASGEHLLGLVNDVLDYAKLDSGHVELEPVRTDVERLLQEVCELLSPRAHAGGIEIAWAAEAGLPPVMADDGRLRQILFNLAGNAVKMTSKGGVLVSVERRGGSKARPRLRFTVRDTGPGLDKAAQAAVFEEFVQTAEGERAGGTGLGLAIVRRLVHAFHGKAGVESEPGAGAAFWFEADFAAAGVSATGQELAGLRVAIASESPIVREAACRQVEASGGWAMAFPTLAEAAASAPRDAVLLVDPSETSAAAKRMAAPPKDRTCLVLLAPESRQHIARYRNAGYAGYLIKPLRRVSLAARILAVAQTGPVASATPAPEDERAAPAGACGARVLLAEDNAVNALLARALLAREGCAVERVANGQEALAALAAAPFDIVLMDMRMPVMDGLAATRALRAQGIETPIVALTANAFEDDRKACLDAGMNDFLTKPIEPAALRAALARWTCPPSEAKLTA